MFIKRFTSLSKSNLIILNTIPKINMRYCSNIPNINGIEYKKTKIQDILNTTKNTNQIYDCMLGSESNETKKYAFWGGCITGIFLPFSLPIGILGFGTSKYLMIKQKHKILSHPEEITSIINSDNRLYEYVAYYISFGLIISFFACIIIAVLFMILMLLFGFSMIAIISIFESLYR